MEPDDQGAWVRFEDALALAQRLQAPKLGGPGAPLPKCAEAEKSPAQIARESLAPEQAAAEPVSPHRPSPEWYARMIEKTLDDDFAAGPGFDPALEQAQASHHVKLLIEAIGQAAQKAGLYNGQVPLTGPLALMLVDDMATCAAAPSAAQPVPTDVMAAAERLATPLHASRIVPELSATAAADQRCANLILSFLRSLKASPEAAPAATMTEAQVEMDLWPKLKLSGVDVTLHDTLCIVRAYEAGPQDRAGLGVREEGDGQAQAGQDKGDVSGALEFLERAAWGVRNVTLVQRAVAVVRAGLAGSSGAAPGSPGGVQLTPMTKAQVDEACKLVLVSTPRSAESWIVSGIRFAEEHHAAALAARQPRKGQA